MAALKPEFTDSFLVWDKSNNYGDFIRIVRQHVIKYCKDRSPDIYQPVLPREKKVPDLWFHIALQTEILHTEKSSLKLAIRMDNLYLVGFQTTAGEWLEFGKEGDTHLISGAKWLGFGGSYLDLIGRDGKLEAVQLGRAHMSYAVDALAKYHPAEVIVEDQFQEDKYEVPKKMLVKLVIMLCEGMRFLTVSDTVNKEFEQVATITELEGKQVRKWEKISEAVFKWAVDPSAKFPELEEVGIKNKSDAAKVVALVKDIPPN